MTQHEIKSFSITNLIKYPFELPPRNNLDHYVLSTNPIMGKLFVTFNNPNFLSGQARTQGRDWDKYPFHYLEMIDNLFGMEANIIEVCSGSINEGCVIVDINLATSPIIVDDGQKLKKIPNKKFNRWRCDSPYNEITAKRMYNIDLPKPMWLLEAGASVCKKGSLLFLLLGNVNYMWHRAGVRRIGYINLTIVPNNEISARRAHNSSLKVRFWWYSDDSGGLDVPEVNSCTLGAILLFIYIFGMFAILSLH